MVGSLFASDLTRLAHLYHTDKSGHHEYTRHYQRHFESLRNFNLNILEIGVGGFESATAGGNSLRMWKKYFPKGKIYGIDIYDKSGIDEDRIKTFCGSQADSEFLRRVVEEIGEVDIIVDDGSHQNQHVIASFETLFPLLSKHGIYAIEDVQTSYWPCYGGRSDTFGDSSTIIGRLKDLINGLNHQEFLLHDYTPSYFDRHIVSIHFYHNLVIIQKGFNDEPGSIYRPDLP